MIVARVLLPFGLLAMASAAIGQTEGSLMGTVLNADGSTMADAPIRARNEATGTDARTRSSEAGTYEFENLPAGTYLVSVAMPCCEFMPYVNDAVSVEAGRINEFDIELQTFNINVEGDDPATVNADLLSRQEVPDLPAPKTPDGRPDLSGVWLPVQDPYPEDPKPLQWAAEIMQERLDNLVIDLPQAHCLPGSPPVYAGASFTTKFVQTPDLVVILFEDLPGFRQIFLDGRGHPEIPNSSWTGHSIGRWEGDTLVVDTVGFNDRGWTEFFPRTEAMHMVERYRRIDYGHLEVIVTYEDPGVFIEPWTQRMVWNLAPDLEIMEYVCENNQWMDAGR